MFRRYHSLCTIHFLQICSQKWVKQVLEHSYFPFWLPNKRMFLHKNECPPFRGCLSSRCIRKETFSKLRHRIDPKEMTATICCSLFPVKVVKMGTMLKAFLTANWEFLGYFQPSADGVFSWSSLARKRAGRPISCMLSGRCPWLVLSGIGTHSSLGTLLKEL